MARYRATSAFFYGLEEKVRKAGFSGEGVGKVVGSFKHGNRTSSL